MSSAHALGPHSARTMRTASRVRRTLSLLLATTVQARRRDYPALIPCATPRNVYIDAGVNWCNSLLLFQSVPEARTRMAEPWRVFGFDANKRIAPFADSCHRALTAGQPLPEPPIPPAGSTRDLMRYAPRYNCSKSQLGLRHSSEHDRKLYKRKLLVPCMQRALARNLETVQADPSLSANASLLQHRLEMGASCEVVPRSKYVFMPAAVGQEEGVLKLRDDPTALLIGGASVGKHSPMYEAAMIDFSSWLRASFSAADFVVLKMDVEGAEHMIIPKMIADGTIKLIDVLLWECHHMPAWWHSPCHKLLDSVRSAGVSIIYQDPYPWSPRDHPDSKGTRRA